MELVTSMGRLTLAFFFGAGMVLLVQCAVDEAEAAEVMVGYDLLYRDWTFEACNAGTCAGYDMTDNLYYIARQSESRGLRMSAGIGYQPHTESLVGRAVGAVSSDESTGEIWAKYLLFENYSEGSYGVGFRFIETDDSIPLAGPMTEPMPVDPPEEEHHRHHRWAD